MTQAYDCPRCAQPVTSEKTQTTFPYGGGSHLVELPVELNVFTCSGCGEQFLDHTAEDAKEEAVRRWLDSSRGQHPSFGPVPPGCCPVCKAAPDEPCDAGLHS